MKIYRVWEQEQRDIRYIIVAQALKDICEADNEVIITMINTIAGEDD